MRNLVEEYSRLRCWRIAQHHDVGEIYDSPARARERIAAGLTIIEELAQTLECILPDYEQHAPGNPLRAAVITRARRLVALVNDLMRPIGAGGN